MISKRLLQIADLVEENKAVFDVGSDHALLPCFLVEKGICPKAYAGEIAEGPLNSGKQNIIRHGLEGKVIPVLSDGLDNAPDDVDIVIIAGMGFHTIRHILDHCNVEKYRYFLVQPNTDVELFREYISSHGYTIEDERIVHDGFYYQIIRFCADPHEPYTDLEIRYGPILLKRRDKVFLDYLEWRMDHLKRINKKAGKEGFTRTINEIGQILYNDTVGGRI